MVQIHDLMVKIDTRSVDELGRVIMPRSLRERYHIGEGDEIAFFDNGKYIIVQKSQASCFICHSLEDLVEIGERNICSRCIEKIKRF